MNAYGKFNIDRYGSDETSIVIPKGFLDGTYERRFRRRLRKAGLSQIQCDILVMRFIDEYSLLQIAEELNIVSSRTVLSILNKTLRQLKEMKYR